jgi:hypothetical protein
VSLTLEQIHAAKKVFEEADVPQNDRSFVIRYYHHKKKRLRKKYNVALRMLGYNGQDFRRFMIDYCHVMLNN